MIAIIVATARNGVIGKEGSLPWHLPAELARFKDITLGHSVIMGRATHESIGRTLPGRQNIVITSNPDYKASAGSLIAGSLDEALKTAGKGEVFVIGGERVFAEALSRADRIYLTKVGADIAGDRYFKYDPREWRQISSEKHPADAKNKYTFEFTILERR